MEPWIVVVSTLAAVALLFFIYAFATAGSFGRNGRMAGDFHWIHALALDSKGNIFTAEVDTGKRVQKFLFKGDAAALRKRGAN